MPKRKPAAKNAKSGKVGRGAKGARPATGKRPQAGGRTKQKQAAAAAATVLLVNMIPQSLSGETNQDSEPNLAVNPANPLQIAGSAFTPNPTGTGNAPIFVSTNGGTTWVLNTTVPSAVSTHDITLKFAGTSNRLFT